VTHEPGRVVRLDPGLDALIPNSAHIEQIATGFQFTEGPLWRAPGTLWFSDIVGNVVLEWSPDGTVREILRPGGYDGPATAAGRAVGPDGMTAARDGVVLCQHGNRRIVHLDAARRITTVVDRFEGKRLNSPNDVVFRSDGALYFTDPPYGLPGQDDDNDKELPFNGVFMLRHGVVSVLTAELSRPNGLAFSPDEHVLYVANSDHRRRQWMRYFVGVDGELHDGHVWLDVTAHRDDGVPNGLKVDELGNVYAAGPGGVWVVTPDGRHLGTIKTPESASNVAWGNDGRMLYITAGTSLYRMRTIVGGHQPVHG